MKRAYYYTYFLPYRPFMSNEKHFMSMNFHGRKISTFKKDRLNRINGIVCIWIFPSRHAYKNRSKIQASDQLYYSSPAQHSTTYSGCELWTRIHIHIIFINQSMIPRTNEIQQGNELEGSAWRRMDRNGYSNPHIMFGMFYNMRAIFSRWWFCGCNAYLCEHSDIISNNDY